MNRKKKENYRSVKKSKERVQQILRNRELAKNENTEVMCMLKCSCCGNEGLVVRTLSDMAQFGGIRVSIGGMKVANVEQARVCTSCGNVMPFVEPKLLTEGTVSLDSE